MPTKQGQIEYIYWFTYYNLDAPSVRYRAKYPLDFAKENLGIKSRLVIPGYAPKRLLNFIKGYFSALVLPKKNSLIVIQRVRSNFIYSNLLKLLVLVRKNLTVYDLDDADYLEHNPKIIHFFARNCNYISAGSPEIANYLKQFNPKVIHTTSPTPDFGILKKQRNTLFTIGWIGGFDWGHKESLSTYLFPALKKLKFECQLIMLGITKDTDKSKIYQLLKENTNIKVVIPNNTDWRNERSLQKMIAQFDVGIATLLNHPVQLAKSGIKAKQYMNNGIPVLCNDLPENNKVVVDGINGSVFTSVTEFSEQLVRFRTMADDEYWAYSKNARQSIEHFSHKKYFAEFEKIKSNRLQSIQNIGPLSVSEST